MYKLKYLLILLGIILIGVVIYFKTVNSQSMVPKYTGPIKTVRIGAPLIVGAAPFWVANQLGYFNEDGINLEIKEFSSGKAALDDMVTNNDLDMVMLGQTPVVIDSFSNDNNTIIAGLAYSLNDTRVVARRDKGINLPSDLKGKKIGVVKGATGHYFLSLFLSQHGLALSDVQIVNTDGSLLAKALIDGSVDAISSVQSDSNTAEKILKDNIISFESKGIYRNDLYLYGNRKWLKDNNENVKRFLYSINRAEDYIKQNNSLSKNIIGGKLKQNGQLFDLAWGDFSFQLFLDQAVFLELEQQARWAQTNNIVTSTTIPNYLNFIYPDALQVIKPEAVTLIR